MTKKEALEKTKGYLTDAIPSENYSEVEEIMTALTSNETCDGNCVECTLLQYDKSNNYWCPFKQDIKWKGMFEIPSNNKPCQLKF